MDDKSEFTPNQAKVSDTQSIPQNDEQGDKSFITEFDEPAGEEQQKNKTEIQRFYEIQKNFKNKTLKGRTLLNRILRVVTRASWQAGQFNVLESLKIDDDWLVNIEGHINHIDNIVRNPKSALKEERLIVNTSKAKKTDSETIRYLSSHTSDIESIKGDEIRPSRLNVRDIDTDLCIYENRFVYALMVRLRSFLEQRYIAIKDQIDCYNTNELKASARTVTRSGDIEYDLRIKLRDKMTHSPSVRQNTELLERIESARTHISALMGSEFARTLSKAKLLMPPINKTNAIRGHTDYRGCYNLWLFLSAYTSVGYSVNIDEHNMELSGEYYDDLAFITAMSIKNMIDNNMLQSSMFLSRSKKRSAKKFKPIKNFSYSVSPRSIARAADDELISQLYYDKIKQLLRDSDDVKRQQDEQLRVGFRAYYKKISALNNNLYNEALELDKYRESIQNTSSLDDKRKALSHYEEGLKRLRLLKSLKESDFNAAAREEKKLAERAAKLRVAIKEQKERQLKEELEKRLERERRELEFKEHRRQARLERERIAVERKQAAIQKRIELECAKQEQKERLAAQKLALQKQKEREKQMQKEQAQKEKDKQKQIAQKEREKAKIKAQKQRQKQRQKQAKQKQQEKLKKQKQLALQKAKNKLKKDK